MKTSEILERTTREEPELREGDIVLLLDTAENGCISAAYAVTAKHELERMETEVMIDMDDEPSQVTVNRGDEMILYYEQLNNRLKEFDHSVDGAKIVYLNIGKHNVVVEGAPTSPGESGSIVCQ